MVSHHTRWKTSYRVISTRFPRLDIFESVAPPEDLENVLALEGRTNDRLRELAGAIAIVPPADRVTGPGASFVMAPFAYVRAGRFSPGGTYGVYYAAAELETAIAETVYHQERFLADTAEPPMTAEKRIVTAAIDAHVADASAERNVAELLHPSEYGASYDYGANVFDTGLDGVSWQSVRRAKGNCIGIYRPRCVQNAHTDGYLEYRWNGTRIDDVRRVESLSGSYPDEPGRHGT